MLCLGVTKMNNHDPSLRLSVSWERQTHQKIACGEYLTQRGMDKVLGDHRGVRKKKSFNEGE